MAGEGERARGGDVAEFFVNGSLEGYDADGGGKSDVGGECSFMREAVEWRTEVV